MFIMAACPTCSNGKGERISTGHPGDALELGHHIRKSASPPRVAAQLTMLVTAKGQALALL